MTCELSVTSVASYTSNDTWILIIVTCHSRGGLLSFVGHIIVINYIYRVNKYTEMKYPNQRDVFPLQRKYHVLQEN